MKELPIAPGSFNIYLAECWWSNNVGDSKGGHFDAELYKKYLAAIYNQIK